MSQLYDRFGVGYACYRRPDRRIAALVLLPHDCSDGFLGAYWRRPHAYLDPAARSAISAFAKIPEVDGGVERLRRDLEDGTWHRRNAHLLDLESVDLGYRLVTIDLER